MRLKLGPHDKNLKDKSSTYAMRKYYQLALAVVCLVSVITLLFYRHEYYRLRYVLEVLNFFGKPGGDVIEPNLCLFTNVSAQGKNRFVYTNPLPVWQRLTDSHYVYSAFWEVSDKDRRVKALSSGIEEEDILDFGCHLWFDVVGLDEPVLAQFSSSKVMKDGQSKHFKQLSNLVFYEFFCRPIAKNHVGIPYGVSFFKTDAHHSKVFVPVHYTELTLSNTTTICIAPTVEPNVQKSTIVEFLSYHQVIGASEFIVYNSGSLSRFIPALTDPSMQEKMGLGIYVLPWNFPFSEVSSFARAIIEQDCLLRSKGKTRSVTFLDWNEYIVPKYHSTLPAMLGDLGKTASLFKVMVAAFCTQLPDTLQSATNGILALRKTHYISEPERDTHIYQPGQAHGRTQRILPGIAVVHRYVNCTEQQLSVAQENTDSTSMLRFAGDLNKSKLMRAWLSGYLFV